MTAPVPRPAPPHPGPAPERRVTSYDVARLAGVAQSTVSRCFQDDSGISPATRQKVLQAAGQLGYVPNALARSLITRRSNLIGVVITRYTLRGNPDVIYAIGESLAAAGKQLLLVTVDGDHATLAALRGLLEYPIEALISCVLIPDDDLRTLLGRRLPVVFYNRAPDRLPVDSVSADHFQAAGRIAELLHAAGHRSFLCVAGPAQAPVSRQRIDGFTGRLRALGGHISAVLETDYAYAQARSAFLAHMAGHPRPDAVFCANDQLAFGVMDACRFDLGWDLPRDISVVGFDDVAEAARPVYELTTMRQDSLAMAREAVHLLLQRLDHPQAPPVGRIVPASFIPRRSARLPPA